MEIAKPAIERGLAIDHEIHRLPVPVAARREARFTARPGPPAKMAPASAPTKASDHHLKRPIRRSNSVSGMPSRRTNGMAKMTAMRTSGRLGPTAAQRPEAKEAGAPNKRERWAEPQEQRMKKTTLRERFSWALTPELSRPAAGRLLSANIAEGVH